MNKNELISMVDFVLMGIRECYKDTFEYNTQYANFLNQPLNISMFVPAIFEGGKWIVLEMPEHFFEWSTRTLGTTLSEYELHIASPECQQYQTALDNVIFKGFECEAIRERCGNVFYLVKDSDGGNIYVSWNNSKTIQDLIKYKPKLAPRGMEQSGLNK